MHTVQISKYSFLRPPNDQIDILICKERKVYQSIIDKNG